ncbi:hypothetical protein D3C85_1086620 [compost metagenome]
MDPVQHPSKGLRRTRRIACVRCHGLPGPALPGRTHLARAHPLQSRPRFPAQASGAQRPHRPAQESSTGRTGSAWLYQASRANHARPHRAGHSHRRQGSGRCTIGRAAKSTNDNTGRRSVPSTEGDAGRTGRARAIDLARRILDQRLPAHHGSAGRQSGARPRSTAARGRQLDARKPGPHRRQRFSPTDSGPRRANPGHLV